ncbi:carbohydrate sulfotransferase 11-like [Macrobrachium rosenbergii]|uniref:carbohydrate sulfotransferase 11-like n=1 Tax=Macrobrachium rosenbergii TaxID=79674 RepID=UPI0034D5069F
MISRKLFWTGSLMAITVYILLCNKSLVMRQQFFPLKEPKQNTWAKEQERRRSILRRACGESSSGRTSRGARYAHLLEMNKDDLLHLLADDKHKVIYCFIPKVGCTSWKRVFMILGNISNAKQVDDIDAILPHLIVGEMQLLQTTEELAVTSESATAMTEARVQLMNEESGENAADENNNTGRSKADCNGQRVKKEKSHLTATTDYRRTTAVECQDELLVKKLENYKKFIVVRHPIERLVSAYFDKIHHKEGKLPMQRKVLPFVRKTRKNATVTDITWPEFVSFVVRKGGRLNAHWMPYESLCLPCQIDYDFILKFETLDEDAEGLLRAIGAPEDFHFPHHETKINASLVGQLEKDLTRGQMLAISHYFGNDFDMFEYSIPA